MDDGPRRILFSMALVSPQGVKGKDLYEAGESVIFTSRYRRIFQGRLDPITEFGKTTPWNDKWERTVVVGTESGQVKADQHLGLLTPQYLRIDALKYNWSPFYFTKELKPEMVRGLLAKYPSDVKEMIGQPENIKRFRIFRFLVQAGWYDDAEKELERILKDLPNEKEKVYSARENLRQLRAQQWTEAIELAAKSGRHEWVQTQLTNFPEKGTDEQLLMRIRSLGAKYERASEDLKQARKFLGDLPGQLKTDKDKQLVEAVAALVGELRLDHFLPPEPNQTKLERYKFQRLEAFLSAARQAERARKKSAKTASAGELLSLAVTGWLLGSNSAEAKIESAVRLWRARQFVLQYQKTHDSEKREKLLYAYQKDNPVQFDEMAQLISFLPPPEPEEMMATGNGKDKDGVLELETNLPWGRVRGVKYLVQLPPEYHHGRPYPVLFVLHHTNEKARDMLDRWRELAAQHGYILVAPAWTKAFQASYEYTSQEHDAVLDVLRDLRRRFQVDSDRVFLFGGAEGGAMAFDVGLSHPDVFAGVIPMCARPRMFSLVYYTNAAVLPFYIVTGDLVSDSVKVTRKHLIQRWVPTGYPSIYIEYKGRGPEWFSAEPPMILDWMSRKKRSLGVPAFGECKTMRQSDDHFYWISVDALKDESINDPKQWNNRVSPGWVRGTIVPQNNGLNVYAHGVKHLTVWIGRDMIDFTKPATIRLNTSTIFTNGGRPIKPSLSTLLEDFYVRADRQQLFYAKVPFDVK